MNSCNVCDDGFRNGNPNKIICDGICRQAFHANCVNFNKDALLHYREMPNLQWFCDSCIIQTRSINVSSSPLNNSTVFVPTSSPRYVQHTFPAANRKRKPIRSVKQTKSSVFLVNKSPIVNCNNENANDLSSPPSKNEMPLVSKLSANGSYSFTTSEFSQSDVAKQKHNSEDFKEITEKPDIKNLSAAFNSYAEILSSSSIAENGSTKVKNSPIKPLICTNVHSQTIVSPSESRKVAYVSNFHPLVTEEVDPSRTTSKNEMPLTTKLPNSLNKYESSEINQADAGKPKHNTPDFKQSTEKSHTISSGFVTRRDVYVSNFHPSVTEEEVVDYLVEKNVISSSEEVSCKKLVSPNVSLAFVSFVSFKMTVSSEVFQKVVNNELWPDGVTAREFVKR